MSRILTRLLGESTGPGPVRARLPMLFEPGLDLAADREDVAAHQVSAAGAPSARREPGETRAVALTGPPRVAADLAFPQPPAAEPGPSAAASPSGPAESRSAARIRPAAPGRPQPAQDAAPAHPGRARQAHPVRS